MKTKTIVLTLLVLGGVAFGAITWLGSPETASAQAQATDQATIGKHDDQFDDKKEAKHEGHDDHADHEQGQQEKKSGKEGHDERAEPAGEDAHGGEVVQLSASDLKEFGIELATAKMGALDQLIELPGEIVLNADTLAHVVPQVQGIVREVRKSIGDSVKAGEVLAVIDSRELAESKAAYLAAIEREKLAG